MYLYAIVHLFTQMNVYFLIMYSKRCNTVFLHDTEQKLSSEVFVWCQYFFSKLICWEKQKQWLKSLDVFTFFLSCKDTKSQHQGLVVYLMRGISSFTTKYETSKVFLKTSSCSLLSLNSRGHWFPVGIGVMEFDPIFSCTKPGLHYAVLILHDQ